MTFFSKSLCVFLAALIALLSVPFAALAADRPVAETCGDNLSLALEPVVGQCGDNLSFTLEPASGRMEVTGSGPMWDYRYTDEDGDHLVERAYEAFTDQIREVVFGEGVTYIGSDAFAGCANLRSVSFSSTVETIGNFAFLSTGLQEIDVPEGVVAVGQQAFSMCDALRRASLPSTVVFLDGLVFEYDGALEELDFGMCDPAVFGCCTAGDCSSLQAISVSPENEGLSAPDGVLFQYDTLWQYPAGKPGSTYVIPNGTSMVFMGAFEGTTHLRSVFVPASVVAFGSVSFLWSSVSDLYYAGSEAQWDEVGKPDDLLTDHFGEAPIAVHFNATVAEMEAETAALLEAEEEAARQLPAEPVPEPVSAEPTAFAVTMTDAIPEPTTAEPVPEPTTAEPVPEPTTAEPATEPATAAPATEPTTAAPVTEPATAAPVTEPATAEPATEPDAPVAAASERAGSKADSTSRTPRQLLTDGAPATETDAEPLVLLPIVSDDPEANTPADVVPDKPCEPAKVAPEDKAQQRKCDGGPDEAPVVPGDADGDGLVTPGDARMALRMAVGLEPFGSALLRLADADGDGKVTPADARLILRAVVGLAGLS